MKRNPTHKACGALFFAFISLMFACRAPIEEKQEVAPIDEVALAMNVFRSLAKIQAATEVGVNYQKYEELLIDARALVNEAHLLLSDEELKKKFESTIEAYTDASKVWDRKIKESSSTIDGEEEPIKAIANKYLLPIKKGAITNYLNADRAMQTIWIKATEELAAAWAKVLEKLKPKKPGIEARGPGPAAAGP